MSKGLGSLQREVLALIQGDLGGACYFFQVIENREGPDFSRATVGQTRYNQVHASLSRVCEQLRQRNMLRIFKEITGSCTLLILTDEGSEAAEAILKARSNSENLD